jgi:hypothetical protein
LTRLYPDHPLTAELLRRVDRGDKIGQSIGGWFTEIRLIADEDGEVGRVIVEEVELDHLAATRSPANPDSWITTLRDKVVAAFRSITLERSIDEAPNYRLSDDPKVQSCGNCLFYKVTEAGETETGHCIMFDFRTADLARSDFICEAWKLKDEDADLSKAITFGPVTDQRATGPIVPVVAVPPVVFDKSSSVMDERAIVPFQDLPIDTASDWSWDAAAQNAILGDGGDDWDRYKKAHVWFDPDKPDTKDGYKLPIAKMIDGKLTCVWRAVTSAMAVLNGARGGADIPETDRQKAYDHLVRYYAKAEEEPPELKAVDDLTPESSDHVSGPCDCHASQQPEAEATSAESPGETMDSAQMAELANLIAAALAPTVTALAKSESAPKEEPKPAAPEAPKADPFVELQAQFNALRERAERQEHVIRRLASEPVRRGQSVAAITTNEHRGDPSESDRWKNIRTMARDSGCEAIATVLSDKMIEHMTAGPYGFQNPDGSQMRVASARQMLDTGLHTFLNACIADGLITNPFESASWQR